MANEKSIADAGAYGSTKPNVRRIGTADLIDALARGLDDFKAMPTHLVFLCLIYPIVTLIFARIYAGYEVLPLVFPLLADAQGSESVFKGEATRFDWHHNYVL